MVHQSHIAALRLEGEIDVYACLTLRRALEPLEGVELAIIDVSKVTYFDLTLINALVHLKSQMLARNGASTVQLVGATPFLRRILAITELSTMFDLPAECALESCDATRVAV